MSFACNACNKTMSAPTAWPTRCPWCGGAVEETAITLTRVEPVLRRVSRNRIGPVHELVIGGAVVTSLLLVLLGIGWFLVSHLRPRHNNTAIAVAATLATDQPALLPAGPVVALQPAVPAAVPPIPLPETPSEQNQRTEQPPVEQQSSVEAKPPIRLPEFPVAEAPPAVPPPPRQAKVEPKKPPQPQPAPQAAPPSASFMGVKAPGKRFCIIADCSGSMAFNNRMVRVKKEMAATLKSLSTDQEFFVIFFSSTAIPMPARSWRRGGKDVKKLLPWIGLQPAEGATEPLPAFKRAFRLSPRPDVIFFLTDGIIPTTVPAQVARLNGAGKNKTPIHTILFGGELPGAAVGVVLTPVRSGRNVVMVPRKVLVPKMEKDEGQLEQIARDSGGTHRFVSDGAAR